MKAIIWNNYGSSEVFNYVEADMPSLGPSEVLQFQISLQRLHSSLDYQIPDNFKKRFKKSSTFEMHK